MTALPTTASAPEITPAHSAATATLSSIRPARVASGDRHPVRLTNVTLMLLRELNVGAGKRSRRKTGHFWISGSLVLQNPRSSGENDFGSGPSSPPCILNTLVIVSLCLFSVTCRGLSH